MPTYSVTVKVEYEQTFEITAESEMEAMDAAGEAAHRDMPTDADMGEVTDWAAKIVPEPVSDLRSEAVR